MLPGATVTLGAPPAAVLKAKSEATIEAAGVTWLCAGAPISRPPTMAARAGRMWGTRDRKRRLVPILCHRTGERNPEPFAVPRRPLR